MQEIHQATEQVGRLTEFGRQYIEEKVHLSKLEAARKIAQVASEVTSKLIALAFGFVALLFIEVALAFLLIQYMDSQALSLAIVGGANLILAIAVVAFRRTLISNSILPYFIRLIFNKSDK